VICMSPFCLDLKLVRGVPDLQSTDSTRGRDLLGLSGEQVASPRRPRQ
jgi:hypothetical protein